MQVRQTESRVYELRQRAIAAVVVSVQSKRMTNAYLRHLVFEARRRKVRLGFFLLDESEVANQQFFFDLSETQARERVHQRTEEIRLTLRSVEPEVICMGWDDYSSNDAFQQQLAKVGAEYEENKRFRNRCNAQVYQNLHPRLESKSIRVRDPAMRVIAPYLVTEIALKIWLGRYLKAAVEFAPTREMGLVEECNAGAFGDDFRGAFVPTEVIRLGEPIDVTLQGVSFSYGDSKSALDNVNLEVRKGEILGVVGPSGSGKTTLLKILAGHLRPTRGEVRFGHDVVTSSRARNRDVVTVFQDYNLFPHLSAVSNVEFGLRTRSKIGRLEARAHSAAALQRFGLSDRFEAKPEEMSGGQQQRVAIARALVRHPRLVLFDEPTASLDSQQRHQLLRLLTDVGSEFQMPTAVLVAHDLEFALAICDRIAVIVEGRVRTVGAPSDLLRAPPSLEVASVLNHYFTVHGVTVAEGFLPTNAKSPLDLPGATIPPPGTGGVLVLPSNEVSLVWPDSEGLVGEVTRVSINGWGARVSLRLAGQHVFVDQTGLENLSKYSIGQAVGISITGPNAVVFTESGAADPGT